MDILNGESQPEVTSTVVLDEVDNNSGELIQEGIEAVSQRKRKGNFVGEDEVDNVSNVPLVDKKVTVPLDEYVGVLLRDRKEPILCHAHGCTRQFKTMTAYNEHYSARHFHKCDICRKSLPGAFFLELHVLESHDSFFEVLAEKKPMYSCLAEECELKFNTPEERFAHFHEDHRDHKLFFLFVQYENLCKSSQEKSKGGRKDKNQKPETKKTNSMELDPPSQQQEHDPDLISTPMQTEASGEIVPEKVGNRTEKKRNSQPKKNNKPHPHPPDISFGRHAQKFRYWSQQRPGSSVVNNENTMDMSAVLDSLDMPDSTSNGQEK